MNWQEYKNIKALIRSDQKDLVFLGIELMKSLKGPQLYSFMNILSRDDEYIFRAVQAGFKDGLNRLALQKLKVNFRNNEDYRESHPLHSAISSLSSLITLELNNANISALPHEIAALKALKSLDLSYNQLKEIPESLSHLKQLNRLYLVGNQLRQIPDALCQLPKLKELNLSNNKLEYLPEAIGKLPQLYFLVINDNPIEYLPESIINIPIPFFQLSNCKNLKALPVGVNQMPKVWELNLRNCSALKELPEDLFDPIGTSLRSVILEGSGITHLPAGIFHHGKYRKRLNLYIKNTMIDALPSSYYSITKAMQLKLKIHCGKGQLSPKQCQKIKGHPCLELSEN